MVKKYWYKTEIWECVLCGSTSIIKERQYTKKPDNYFDRVIVYLTACGKHFM